MALLILTFLGGILTIISPCILPVLPFVFSRADQPFRKSGLPLLAGMALTFAVLSALFIGIYLPGQVVFSNDGPLGRLMSQCHRLPGRFMGCWEDLNSVGLSTWGAPPNISYGLQFLLGPPLFAKLYPKIGRAHV